MNKRSMPILIGSGLAFLLSIIAYIVGAVKSFSSDGYGYSVSYGNTDLLALAIIFILLLIYGIYVFVFDKQKKTINPLIDKIVYSFIGLVGAIYFLYVAIEKTNNGAKGIDQFIYYGTFSLMALSVLLYGTIAYFTYKKKELPALLSFIASFMFVWALFAFGIWVGSMKIRDKETIEGIVFFADGIFSLILIVPAAFEMFSEPSKKGSK